MTKRTLFSIAFLALAASVCYAGPKARKAINPVNFSDVVIEDGFWSPRLQTAKEVTQKVCIDQIENKTGRILNFENAAKGEGKHSGIFFDDSDVYKALEGMAYSLQTDPDPQLEAKCDEWIDKIAAAQQPDGYINTYYTLTGLDNRWTNMDKHEMYCAGHLLEAGIAYYNVTGKDKLLNVATAMVNHIMNRFGPGKLDWVPGHEEIELALVKLYSLTGEKKYLDFAQWLLDERGHGHSDLAKNYSGLKHFQDQVPVRDLEKIQGHAVRAMYLFCGMSDVASYTGDEGYMNAMYRVWDNIVNCKMYVTGGIGHSKKTEGFADDFDLPNDLAYCETCASIGMVLWNWRMNGMTGDAKYIDILERALYNGVLSGVSIKGDRFFYVNPLESDGNHHRQEWYGCACCPSNICRFIPSMGNYIYGTSKDAVYVNLFVGSKTTIDGLTISQSTSYPWNGDVNLSLTASRSVKKTLKIRIPGWCKDWKASIDGQEITNPVMDKGYLCITCRWKGTETVSLSFGMPVVEVRADPRVKADEGKKAIMRGPVVYCMEGLDNAATYDSAYLDSAASFTTEFRPDFLGGVQTIAASTEGGTLNLIPYYAWDNREACPMKVWINAK